MSISQKSARQRMFGKAIRMNPMSIKERGGGAKKQRQVLSLGRDKPDPPQAAIVITAFFLKNEMQLRRALVDPMMSTSKENEELLAPFGSAECFDVRQGALVFQRRPDNEGIYMPARMAPNPVSDVYAFECVNGLLRGTQLQFVGWAATDNWTTRPEKDTNGTVQIVGTCTAINVGPETIPAMAQVYFDEEPYVLYSNGGKVPGVVEIGQPGGETQNNSTPAKYRPSIYGMTDTDLASIVRKASDALELSMMTEIQQHYALNEQVRNTAFKELVETATLSINNITKGKPPSFPIKKYLWIHFFHLCLLFVHKDTRVDADLVGTYVVDKVVKKMRKQRRDFNVSIGQSDSSQGLLFAVFDHNGGNDSSSSDASTYSSDSSSSSLGMSRHVPLSQGKGQADPLTVTNLYINYGRQIMLLRDITMIAVRAWMSDHHIGMSLSTSESGAPLRLNIGYGRA